MKIRCIINVEREFDIKDENLEKILMDGDSSAKERKQAFKALEKITGCKIGGKEISKEEIITSIEEVETDHTIYEW